MTCRTVIVLMLVLGGCSAEGRLEAEGERARATLAGVRPGLVVGDVDWRVWRGGHPDVADPRGELAGLRGVVDEWGPVLVEVGVWSAREREVIAQAVRDGGLIERYAAVAEPGARRVWVRPGAVGDRATLVHELVHVAAHDGPVPAWREDGRVDLDTLTATLAWREAEAELTTWVAVEGWPVETEVEDRLDALDTDVIVGPATLRTDAGQLVLDAGERSATPAAADGAVLGLLYHLAPQALAAERSPGQSLDALLDGARPRFAASTGPWLGVPAGGTLTAEEVWHDGEARTLRLGAFWVRHWLRTRLGLTRTQTRQAMLAYEGDVVLTPDGASLLAVRWRDASTASTIAGSSADVEARGRYTLVR